MDKSYPAETANDPEKLFSALIADFSSRWPHSEDKPEEAAAPAIRALWLRAAGRGISIQGAAGRTLPALHSDQLNVLNELIQKRLAGTPLAHILGWQQFLGIELMAGPEALIPRKETEILGNASLDRLRQLVATRGSATVIDVCTGSGNLAISFALHEPHCKVFASDLCDDAVGLARKNAELHGLHGRVQFRVGDLFVPFADGTFDGSADMIVCNPPYLSSAKVQALPKEIGGFEPRAAFDAGSFGIAIISRLISEAPRFLKAQSPLCFEVGLGQGPFFAERLGRAGLYQRVETISDAAGEVRALIAWT